MPRRKLRRRCRQIIRSLDIPDPFDVRQLCTSVARTRERPIDLLPVVMPPDSPSGVWVATPDRDYILFASGTGTLHQEHIILHELGHLLNDDPAGSPVLLADIAQLRPGLDPRLVQRMLYRTAYSAVDEFVAETLATMILEKANRWTPKSEWPAPSGEDVRQRISSTIEPAADRRPR